MRSRRAIVSTPTGMPRCFSLKCFPLCSGWVMVGRAVQKVASLVMKEPSPSGVSFGSVNVHGASR